MSAKPYRNSRGVNKPFRSPFNTASESSNDKSTINTPERNKVETPLKTTVAKRLYYQQTYSPKKICLSKENEDCEENIEQIKSSQLCRSDLEALRQRIKQKQEVVHNLKTSILYRKKNKAEDIESAIEKWTKGCQNALMDYQKMLQDRSGQTVPMSEILSSFNINPDIVRYSTEDDIFC